jgi:uncharacterized RDD family membrane protein YckC
MSAPTPFPDQPQDQPNDPWGPQEPQWGSQPPQTGAPPLSGWWRRVAGYLLDGIILAVVAIIPAAIIAAIAGGKAFEPVWIVLAIIFQIAYPALTMGRTGQNNGQTLGHQALGIRVIRIDGAPMTAGGAIVRQFLVLGILMGICGLVQLVNLLWPLWDEKNQALHDKVVITLVVLA